MFLRDEGGLTGLREALSMLVASSPECADIGLFPVQENELDSEYTKFINTRKIVHEVNKAVEYSVHCYSDPILAQSDWCQFWTRDHNSGQDGLVFTLSLIAQPENCPVCAAQGIEPLATEDMLALLELPEGF